jgi:starch phosphorylase
VQLIIAGKAHPQDVQGQQLIRQWIQFIRRPEVRPHIVFLSDYDMQVGAQLVQGVDVWINTPRRPWEASGTSGMKVLVNGGINLSELDGWWVEAYSPELGWALGDGKEHSDDLAQDAIEANALYELLEQQVIPEFYERDAQAIPKAWLNRIRESMAQLTPRFSATRTVCEYTEQLYLPAADAYHKRAAENGLLAKQIIDWKQNVSQHWDAMHFGALRIETRDGQHYFDVEVYLDGLSAQSIQVEIYAEAIDDKNPVVYAMQLPESEIELASVTPSIYRTNIPANRPASDFTARVVARFDNVSVPLEMSHIRWQG